MKFNMSWSAGLLLVALAGCGGGEVATGDLESAQSRGAQRAAPATQNAQQVAAQAPAPNTVTVQQPVVPPAVVSPVAPAQPTVPAPSPTTAGGNVANSATPAPSPSLGSAVPSTENPTSGTTVISDGVTTVASLSPAAPSPTVTQAPSQPQAPASVASVCGPDIGGWTTPVPTRLDPSVPSKDLRQPGSRLMYISAATGNDATGALYFWNGSAIVDEFGKTTNAQGVAYGNDPMNPSVAVKAFKRWAHVSPRRPATADIGSKGTGGSAWPLVRAGFPDWWLFRRGETFDLYNDLMSYERESTPAATVVNASLAVSAGKSATERQIIGAYGDPCAARPRFVNPAAGFVSRLHRAGEPAFRHVAYLSLHFDGNDRAGPGSYLGINLNGIPKDGVDILFEDVWVDGVQSMLNNHAGEVTFRRSIITDAFKPDGGHVQGLYYAGTRDGRLRIEESIFMRSGFRDNPKTVAWPPSGNQIWSIYSRNLYINAELNSMASHMIDSVSLMGASGDQFRPGLKLERNFFYQGYVNMGASGGYPSSDGPSGRIVDNVLQRFVASGTNENRGHPGWGFQLFGGTYGVEVKRNIVTGAQHAGNTFGLDMTGVNWDCNVRNVNMAVRDTRIEGNIFDTGSAPGAIRVMDGGMNNSCATLYSYPNVRGNTVSSNTLINASGKHLQVLAYLNPAATTTDTAFANNAMYPTRAAAAAALGWPDPDRTLRTYLLSKNVPVTSADGYPEYYALATAMRKGRWHPDWTGRSLVNYMRAGFSMPALQ